MEPHTSDRRRSKWGESDVRGSGVSHTCSTHYLPGDFRPDINISKSVVRNLLCGTRCMKRRWEGGEEEPAGDSLSHTMEEQWRLFEEIAGLGK
jgi:hypothetical protein